MTLPPSQSPPLGPGDITVSQLATRTLQAFRKFWPKVQLSTQGAVFPPGSHYFYDFNGNGVMDGPYILHGHECLVFFLGGIPLPTPLQLPITNPDTIQFGMTGFGKDPTNPFSNSIVGNSMYNANRQAPLYEFSPGRLFLDPTNLTNNGGIPGNNGTSPGIPGYYDTLNNGPPTGIGSGSELINFFAYFSAYGNGNYDPNDVNFFEADTALAGPIELQYIVNFPTTAGTVAAGSGTAYLDVSPSPNPYTSTATAATSSGTVTYQTPQTFQIISAGADGQYGVGGQYVPPSQSSTNALPFDPVHTYNGGTSAAETDSSIRRREADNMTNFKSGTLQ